MHPRNNESLKEPSNPMDGKDSSKFQPKFHLAEVLFIEILTYNFYPIWVSTMRSSPKITPKIAP